MSDDRKLGNWSSHKCLDMYNRPLSIGDKVAKATTSGRAVIEDGKVYLNNSKVAVVFPGRLLIVNNSIP